MVTLTRCPFIDTRTGRRCDAQVHPTGRHSFTGWGAHAGADPDRFYPLATDLNERTDMAKQQIVTEKTAPEENETDSTEAEATGTKYEKYPKDQAQWTPEHDLKLFGDVARLMARAPYAAQCRMFPYLQGLISPNHRAEEQRQKAEYIEREKMDKAEASLGLAHVGRYADDALAKAAVPNNGLVGSLRY